MNISIVDCHNIAQELSTRIETNIDGEFSYKINNVLELIMLLVMMFYSDYLHFELLRNKIKIKISMLGCHNIAQELSTRIETDIDCEFSYKMNYVLDLILLLVMMFYTD